MGAPLLRLTPLETYLFARFGGSWGGCGGRQQSDAPHTSRALRCLASANRRRAEPTSPPPLHSPAPANT